MLKYVLLALLGVTEVTTLNLAYGPVRTNGGPRPGVRLS